nr:flagellin [uncultured Halomonas sp.]
MTTINTNLMAQQSLIHRDSAQSSLATALERLSTGLRINSAKDDAAGLAIANRMEADQRAGSQVSRGINDAISLTQTAEGGLNGINDLLQRSRELAVQAANGTLSDADRATINEEYLQLRDEIDRIAMTTEAFDKYLLAPSTPPSYDTQLGDIKSIRSIEYPDDTYFDSGVVPLAFIPAGSTGVTLTTDSLGRDDDIQLFSRDGKHLVGTPVRASDTDPVWVENGITDGASLASEIFTEANGFPAGTSYDDSALLENNTNYDPAGGVTGTYNGMTFTYSGDGDRFGSTPNDGHNASNRVVERVSIDTVTEPIFVVVAGSGQFTLDVEWQYMPGGDTGPRPTSEGVEVVMSAGFGEKPQTLTIEPTPADSTSLGLERIRLDPREEALKALAAFDGAMAQVDGYRGQYGALNNRFEGAIENLAQQQVNTAAAKSRIEDADYAQETSQLARAQILQQASTSLLAQANQLPQNVLSLLA